MNSRENFKKNNLLYLSAFAFLSAGVVLMVLFFEFEMVKTVSLGVWGLVSMCLALYLVITSSGNYQASYGVWFVALLVFQHGIGWMFAEFFGEAHYSRTILFTSTTLSRAVAIAGTGILSFSVAYTYYLAVLRKKYQSVQFVADHRNPIINQLSWLLILFWGFLVFAFEFMGGLDIDLGSFFSSYIFRSIFGYLGNAIVLIIILKLLGSGKPKQFPALLLAVFIMGGYVFLIGRRQEIIPLFLSTIVLSAKWNFIKVKTKELAILGLLAVSVLLGIVYIRATYGREFFNISIDEQAKLLVAERPRELVYFNESLKYDLGYRLNASNILLGKVAEYPGGSQIWFEPISYSLKKMIPGFIWTSKEDLVAGELPRLISIHYQLIDVDYIATYIAVFYAMGRIPLTIIFSALFGFWVAFLDVRFSKKSGLLVFLLSIGLAMGLLSIDHSMDKLFLQIRNVLFLYIIFKMSSIIRNIFTRSE